MTWCRWILVHISKCLIYFFCCVSIWTVSIIDAFKWQSFYDVLWYWALYTAANFGGRNTLWRVGRSQKEICVHRAHSDIYWWAVSLENLFRFKSLMRQIYIIRSANICKRESPSRTHSHYRLLQIEFIFFFLCIKIDTLLHELTRLAFAFSGK